MLDIRMRPIYDDSLFRTGLCMGDPMDDMSGFELKPALIRGYLLEVMQGGKNYKRDDLQNMVTVRHETAGGLPSTALHPVDQFKKTLHSLETQGVLRRPMQGYWSLAGEDFPDLPIEQEAVAEAMENAEVTFGDGAESIYGWYLPTYREIAEMKGEERFPIKVGRTVRDPQRRIEESWGMAPERPVLGIVLKVDDSGAWERFIHSVLTLDGQKIGNAIGQEWFVTNPEELREIVSAKMDDIRRKQREKNGKGKPSLAIVQEDDQ